MKKFKGDEQSDGAATELPKYPIRKDEAGLVDGKK